nr:SNF2 domain-containing protein CLASSY 4-like [Solanum lycopersicum]
MKDPAETENQNKGRTYFLRPRYMDRSKSMNEESSDDEDSDEEGSDHEDCDDQNKLSPPEEKEHVPVKETIPLVFRFEDEDPVPPVKEEYEKEIEDYFAEMKMCLLEKRISLTNSSPVLQMQSEKLSDCQMGNHKLKLDEQIGHICPICSNVILEMKYIFPDFARRPRQRHRRKYLRESPSIFRASDSSADQDSAIYEEEGTVWDLVSPNVKAAMYPHQRGGFEYMWKHIAGAIKFERLREHLSKSRGDALSHTHLAPGKPDSPLCFFSLF